MKRALLVAVAAFGAAAIGALLFLGGDGDANLPRAERGEGPGGDDEPGDPRFVRTFPPGAMPEPKAVPRPPLAESPEAIEARGRHARRVVELVEVMTDPGLSPEQRMEGARELREILRLMGQEVSPETRDGLLRLLADAPPDRREKIAGAIGLLEGDEGTARALVGMLESGPGDATTRRAILSALGMMRVADVAPALLELVGKGRDDERLMIRTIGRIAKPEVLEGLFARLDEPLAPASRAEIERVLQERPPTREFMGEVAAALEGAEPQKRRSLFRILSASTDPAHAAKVRDLLQRETDLECRALAIQALGKFGDPESGRALLAIVQNGSSQDQQRATWAIRSIRNRETVGVLAEGWTALGAGARSAVMDVISRLPEPTERLTGIAREKGLFDPELPVRIAAARTLGQRGRDESVEALADYIGRSRERAEWSAAFLALENIGTPKAAAAALEALGVVANERERVRLEERFRRIADGAG